VDLDKLIALEPSEHGVQAQVYGADEMVAVMEWAIDNYMYVLIDSSGHVHLYQDPERPIPLNVVNIREYQKTDS